MNPSRSGVLMSKVLGDVLFAMLRGYKLHPYQQTKGGMTASIAESYQPEP